MKNILLNLFSLLIIFISISSCGTEEEPNLSNSKSITEFIINEVVGTIDNDEKSILFFLPAGTDLSNLIPEISISSKASVDPASGVAQDFTDPVVYTVTAEDESTVDYLVTVYNVCAREENIHSFSFDGKDYDLIMENKSWTDAAACAKEMGGYLARIDDNLENNAIYEEIMAVSSIDLTKTVSYDGGSASYVWIGGNDIAVEGTWIWDGTNSGSGDQFWEGDINGSAVGGLFAYWGNEPDNYTNQDALAFALTQWPVNTGSLGSAKQWNDVKKSNELYFVIEYD